MFYDTFTSEIKNEKETRIVLPMFHSVVVVILADSGSEWVKAKEIYPELENIDLSANDSGAFTLDNIGGYYFMFFSREHLYYSIVAHECLHAVRFICKNLGISFDDDETQCYMLGYIMNQTMDILKNYYTTDVSAFDYAKE